MNLADRLIEVRRMRVGDIAAHARNPKRHPARQQDALKETLRTLGQADVLKAYHSERNGGALTLYDGHARQGLDPNQEWHVAIFDLTDAEADDWLRYADPIAALAEVDNAILASLLEDASTDSTLLAALLSERAAGAGLFTGAGEAGNGGDDFDTTPDDGPTCCQAGDLWVIGGVHRLIVGDCTDAATVGRLMGNDKADAIVSDPPYGMRLDADFSSMKNNLHFAREKGVRQGRKYDNVTGDHQDFDASSIVTQFNYVDEQFWFGADYYSVTLGNTMHSGAWLVWDKRLDEDADRMFGSCFELIWSKQKHKRDVLRHKWAGIFGTEHEPQRGRQHPNQKPVRLIEDLMERYTASGDIILDLFAGSGTTLIAAVRTGRCAFLCEIEPKYASVVLARAEAEGLHCERIASCAPAATDALARS